MTASIGVDLGGTKTEVVLLAGDGRLAWRHRQPTPVSEGPAGIIRGIGALVRQARAEAVAQGLSGGPPPPTGVGTPGSLSVSTGLMRNSNTTCLNGLPVQSLIEDELQQSVVIANDANCFTLAEANAGAGSGQRLTFGVILGTGCGGGLVLDGQLWAGPSRLAG